MQFHNNSDSNNSTRDDDDSYYYYDYDNETYTGNDTYDECSSYYGASVSIRRAWLFVGYPILVLGIIGHLLVPCFLLHAAFSDIRRTGRRRLSLPPVAVYLLPLSACGLTALLTGLLPSLAAQHSCYGTLLLSSEHTGLAAEVKCRLVKALQYYSLQLYAWLTACIAVERACAFWRPHVYRCFFRHHGAEATVCACALILLVPSAIPFVSYGVDAYGDYSIRDHLLTDMYVYVDFAVYSVLPLAVMTPCNAFAMWRIAGCRQRPASDRQSLPAKSATRRALPLAIASLCMNGALLLTAVPVSVELWKISNSDHSDNGSSSATRDHRRSLDERYDHSQLGKYRHANVSLTGAPVTSEHENHGVEIRAAWCAGLLASYLFSASYFYVYLAVSFRFRQNAKQLLLAASGSLGGRRASHPASSGLSSRNMSLTGCGDATLGSRSAHVPMNTLNK